MPPYLIPPSAPVAGAAATPTADGIARAEVTARQPRGTEAEAHALADELEALIVPEHPLAQPSERTGADLTGPPLDGPPPRPAGAYASRERVTA